MRIISGKAKGKKILNPKDKTTRPLKDRVRESIFNIITHSNLLATKFDEVKVLDLFAGVGSFGLEAISRGAKKVIFVEKYKPAMTLLKKNLEILEFNKNAEVINNDLYEPSTFKKLKERFNLIFLDPPFNDKNINILLKNISNYKFINSKTLIIIHRKKLNKEKFIENFSIIREEIYGLSKIIFGYFNV